MKIIQSNQIIHQYGFIDRISKKQEIYYNFIENNNSKIIINPITEKINCTVIVDNTYEVYG